MDHPRVAGVVCVCVGGDLLPEPWTLPHTLRTRGQPTATGDPGGTAEHTSTVYPGPCATRGCVQSGLWVCCPPCWHLRDPAQ